jgi:hypothetical protein
MDAERPSSTNPPGDVNRARQVREYTPWRHIWPDPFITDDGVRFAWIRDRTGRNDVHYAMTGTFDVYSWDRPAQQWRYIGSAADTTTP